MKKNHFWQSALFASALLFGFTACSSDDEIKGASENVEKRLTLTINTGKLNTMRATSITDADATTTKTSDELTINRIAVGIFKTDGTLISVQELTSGTGNGKFTQSSTTATADIVTNNLTSTGGDEVLIAINAPANHFAGVTSKTGFQTKLSLSDALGSTTADATKLPMYGEGTTVAPTGGSTKYTAAINVQHQVSKVILKDITVAFDAAGSYNDAIFTPKEFFLINVPDNVDFTKAAWISSISTYYAGNTTPGNTVAQTLTTGDLASPTALSVSGTTSKTYNNALYTLPSQETTNNIRLVIAGDFDADGDGTAEGTVYYPVNLNWKFNETTNAEEAAETSTDAKKVYPNRKYICSVTIKTKGATAPDKKVDPEVATITVTVQNWSAAVTQDVTFK